MSLIPFFYNSSILDDRRFTHSWLSIGYTWRYIYDPAHIITEYSYDWVL